MSNNRDTQTEKWRQAKLRRQEEVNHRDLESQRQRDLLAHYGVPWTLNTKPWVGR